MVTTRSHTAPSLPIPIERATTGAMRIAPGAGDRPGGAVGFLPQLAGLAQRALLLQVLHGHAAFDNVEAARLLGRFLRLAITHAHETASNTALHSSGAPSATSPKAPSRVSKRSPEPPRPVPPLKNFLLASATDLRAALPYCLIPFFLPADCNGRLRPTHPFNARTLKWLHPWR